MITKCSKCKIVPVNRPQYYCNACSCQATLRYSRRNKLRNVILSPESKFCPKCKTNKTASDFSPALGVKNGLSSVCKNCLATNSRNKTKIRKERDIVEYKLRNMFNSAKARSKAENCPFDLDFSYLIEKFHSREFCPYLNIKINWDSTKTNPFSPSIDKTIPILGYVKENVEIISHQANTMKNNASKELLIIFAKSILEKFNL